MYMLILWQYMVVINGKFILVTLFENVTLELGVVKYGQLIFVVWTPQLR